MTNDREAMLRTAADFLGRRPNATQDEIAKALGMSRATLHRHFAGRAELVQALSDMAGHKLHTAVQTARPREGSATEALGRLVEAFEKDAPFLALFYSVSQEGDEATAHPVWKEIDAAVLEVFERGQSSGEFTARITAAWMAEAFYSLIAAGAWAIQSGRCAQRDFTRMVTHMVLCGARDHREDEQST